MPNISKLNQLLIQQNSLMEEITKEAKSFDADKLVSEVERLKAENEILSKNYAQEKAKNKELDDENQNLTETLASHIYSEKSCFLRNSEAKLNAYFDSGAEDGINALTKCEKFSKDRFETCRKAIAYEFGESKEKWRDKIDMLEKQIAEESRRLKEEYRKKAAESKYIHKLNTAPLEEQEIDEEKANRVLRQSKAERFIGASLLGKIGAVLIIVAVIFLSYLAYDRFNSVLKCIFLFAIAAAVFVLALFLNRKKCTPFSITILSLSIGLFYAALAISYFSLRVFDGIGGRWIAFPILVAITALGYILSSKYKSQPVAIFAQIGGYLPIIAIMAARFGEEELVYAAMVYFLILSVLGFLLSTKFKWQLLNYVAFGLSFIGIAYITISVGVVSSTDGTWGKFNLIKAFALLYIFLSFAIYIVLPILTNIRVRTRFNTQDFILMFLNTSASMPMLFTMFYVYGIGDYAAYLALLFAAVYFGLYFLTRKFFTLEFNVKTLFYLVGMAFIFTFPTMLPVENRATWFMFGWSIQGAALLIYGLLRERRPVFRVGLVVSLVALFNFLITDLFLNVNHVGSSNIFAYKYAVLTLLGISIVGACVHKRFINIGTLASDDKIYRDQRFSPAHIFSGMVYLNTLGFVIYFINKIYYWSDANLIFRSNVFYSMLILIVLAAFIFAAIIPKLFKTRVFNLISIFLGGASILAAFIVNSFRLNAFSYALGKVTRPSIDATLMLLLLAIASICVLFDLYIKLTYYSERLKRSGSVVATTFYTLILFTHIMLIQYNLKFYNITFSITYILAAMFLIGLGLYYKSPLTRRFALFFAALSIVKLALLDTWKLELYLRIIIYTIFGVTLIAMSFLYQLFYKKFGDTKVKIKKDNDTEY